MGKCFLFKTNLEESVFGLGSIQQSILTEAQFQSMMGTGWVAMKGQSIAGSLLDKAFGISTLPDARSRFLRNSDAADTNLMVLVADTTKKNGLALAGAISGGSASLSNNTVASDAHSHRYTGRNAVAYVNGTGLKYTAGETVCSANDYWVTSSVYAASGDPGGTKTVGLSFTAANNGTLAIGAGDAETAPKHIIVNTFVKID